METSLRFDSRTKHLCLFAKEKFSNDDNYVLTVRPLRAPSSPERPNPNPRAGVAGGSRRDDDAEQRGFLHPTRSRRARDSGPDAVSPAFRRRAYSANERRGGEDTLTLLFLPRALRCGHAAPRLASARSGFRLSGHEGWARGEPRVRA